MAVARVDDQELVLLSSLPRSAWKGEPVKTLQESALGRVVNVIPDVSMDRALVRLSDGTTVKRVPKKLILLAHNSREAQELYAAEAGAVITHPKQRKRETHHFAVVEKCAPIILRDAICSHLKS